MPFINAKTNVKLSDEKKEAVKNGLFDSISVIPGKSDRYLMTAIEDGISMAFHRDSESAMAMVEVKIFGSSTKDAYGRLTGEICRILGDVAGIDGQNCYVKVEEVKYWGYNGFMF